MPADALRTEATLPSAHAEGEVARVRCERLADPVTGLPILRYRFAGSPSLRPGEAAPAGAWRVLRVVERDGGTVLDLEHAAGAERVDGRPDAVDDVLAAAVLATLEAAAACDVAHGDLGAHRVYVRGERVWLEGYGVPWRPDPDPHDDARTLAAALLDMPGSRLTAPMRARLAGVRDGGPADPGPTSAAGVAMPGDGPGPAPAAPAHATADGPFVAAPAPPSAEGPPVAAPAPPSADGPPVAAPAPPSDVASAVRRGPPPGSRVRAGGAGALAVAHARVQGLAEGAARGRTLAGTHALRLVERAAARRRPLLAALLGGAALWWGLAAWEGDTERPTARAVAVSPGVAATPAAGSGRPAATYVVTVRLDPPGHPPASLVVLASPGGSRWTPGAVIGSVPSVVTLDREGRWSFEARFADRRSERAEAFVPFDRDLVVTFLDPAAAGP